MTWVQRLIAWCNGAGEYLLVPLAGYAFYLGLGTGETVAFVITSTVILAFQQLRLERRVKKLEQQRDALALGLAEARTILRGAR